MLLTTEARGISVSESNYFINAQFIVNEWVDDTFKLKSFDIFPPQCKLLEIILANSQCGIMELKFEFL